MEGNGYPPHYSQLKNSIDRGAWQTTVHGVTKKSDITKQQQGSLLNMEAERY